MGTLYIRSLSELIGVFLEISTTTEDLSILTQPRMTREEFEAVEMFESCIAKFPNMEGIGQ